MAKEQKIKNGHASPVGQWRAPSVCMPNVSRPRASSCSPPLRWPPAPMVFLIGWGTDNCFLSYDALAETLVPYTR